MTFHTLFYDITTQLEKTNYPVHDRCIAYSDLGHPVVPVILKMLESQIRDIGGLFER